MDLHQFGFGVAVTDVITCDKFFGNRWGRSNLWGVESQWFP